MITIQEAIVQIRAEIERYLNHYEKSKPSEFKNGEIFICTELLSYLDTLAVKDAPANLGNAIEKYYGNIPDDKDKVDAAWFFMNTGWNFGYLKGREDAHKPAIEVGLPKRCDDTTWDLDKEYKEYVEDDPVYSKLVNRNAGMSVARHFYELGKNTK